MRYIALEYAIAEACDGGATLHNFTRIADIGDAIYELAAPEEFGANEKQARNFKACAHLAAIDLWHKPHADYSLPMPWREGFVLRAWRVPTSEARQWRS